MYIKPFGSLFGDTASVRAKKPGYLGQTEATVPVEEPKAQPVIPTIARKYKSEPKHPKAKLLLAKHDKKVSEQETKITKKDIKKLQRQKLSLESLIKILDSCKNLDDLQVTHISDRIKKLSTTFQKIEEAKKLKKLTEQAQDRIHKLDAKIAYLEGMKQLKAEGVSLEERKELESVQASAEFRADATPTTGLPVFQAPVDAAELARQQKIISDSLKASQLGSSEVSKQVTKVISELPPRVVTEDPRIVEKEVEKAWVAAKELEYKLTQLKEEKAALEKSVSALQEQAAALSIEVERAKPALKPFIARLHLLTELKPNLVNEDKSVIGMINSAFRGVSKLEDVDSEPTSVADSVASEAMTEADSTLNELKMREYAVEKLQAEIEERPIPAPPVLMPVRMVDKSEHRLFKHLVKIAPIVLAALVLIKLMR